MAYLNIYIYMETSQWCYKKEMSVIKVRLKILYTPICIT